MKAKLHSKLAPAGAAFFSVPFLGRARKGTRLFGRDRTSIKASRSDTK
ncbi:MAG: hypothetical protein OEZ39_06290 [Gammaproteobacteria bacterium]|nr:hypothetical protein [Gammaproteobacteria bacterium]MDH5651465.1 hypothetical protein [Gammaproteobacteria bacterium]